MNSTSVTDDQNKVGGKGATSELNVLIITFDLKESSIKPY